MLYRGVSLTKALSVELATGIVSGHTVSLYKGRLDTPNPNAHVSRGTPVEELAWWKPEGMEDEDGYFTETQGVTGGFTHTVGAAIGFGPIVMYFDRLGSGGRINYNYRYFDATPGALAWVYGDNIEGEVRDQEHGLIGLTSMGDSGPVVWRWGEDELRRDAMQYQDEREALVWDDEVDISRTLSTVAIVLEGRRTPTQMLANFDGYHAGYADEGENTARWSTEKTLATLHDEFRSRAGVDIPELWTINLNSTLMEKFARVPESAFDFAYDGEAIYDEYDAVPTRLLGGD